MKRKKGKLIQSFNLIMRLQLQLDHESNWQSLHYINYTNKRISNSKYRNSIKSPMISWNEKTQLDFPGHQNYWMKSQALPISLSDLQHFCVVTDGNNLGHSLNDIRNVEDEVTLWK